MYLFLRLRLEYGVFISNVYLFYLEICHVVLKTFRTRQSIALFYVEVFLIDYFCTNEYVIYTIATLHNQKFRVVTVK